MNTFRSARRTIVLIAIASVALLAGCASTPDRIVGTPATLGGVTVTPGGTVESPSQPLPIQISDPVIVKDLKSTAANLDQAVAIGALSADDPAPSCVHDFLRRAGVELPPGAVAAPSFKPANDGVFSLGSIAYIIARQQQAAAASGGIQVSRMCLALVGQIHLDALAVAAKGARGLLGLSGIGSIGALGGAIVPGVGFVPVP